jgi:type II secretory pathway component PulF
METTKNEAATKASAPTKHKWLKRFGTFMTMDGWLLVLALVIGIVILVSVVGS